MKVASPAPGAFGIKHLDAIAKIDGIEVVSLVGRTLDSTKEVAAQLRHWPRTTDLAESLARPEVDAVILSTPTQMHASQAIASACEAGKHVQVEIPMADRLADAEEVAHVQKETGQGRDGRPHAPLQSEPPVDPQEDRRPARLKIQQMDVQTYFFRRKNINALGQPRTWTDHLLWHHAATRSICSQYQTGRIVAANAVAGADASRTRHRDGHVDPVEEQHRRDLHAVAVVQQRRPARHVLPLHLRQRHLHRALRRPVRRQGERRSTCRRSMCR